MQINTRIIIRLQVFLAEEFTESLFVKRSTAPGVVALIMTKNTCYLKMAM